MPWSLSTRWAIALVFAFPVVLVGAFVVLALRETAQARAPGYALRIALPEVAVAPDLPRIDGPSDTRMPLVVIDPGHGGRDPGAAGETTSEKALVLSLALALRDALLEEGGVRVALTREDDRFLTLGERSELARQLDADLFLSIHADASENNAEAAGGSVYTLAPEASDAAARRFAARENRAGRLNGRRLDTGNADVDAILLGLAQQRALGEADRFARVLEREGRAALPFHPRAQRQANLAVLRVPDVPAVLYETGYLTNAEEAQRLASPAGRHQLAEAVARAIRVHFAGERQAIVMASDRQAMLGAPR